MKNPIYLASSELDIAGKKLCHAAKTLLRRSTMNLKQSTRCLMQLLIDAKWSTAEQRQPNA
jgi:hypothetical protein